MTESHREVQARFKQGLRCKVFGATYLVATCRCQELHGSMVPEKNSDAACMNEIERTERKSSVQANPSRITPLAIFCRPSRFRFFVRLENTASCIYMLDDMLARANSVCLPALPCSDWRVLALLLVARVYCAVLFCAVLAVLAVLAVRTMVLISRYLFDDARRQHASMYSYVVRLKESPAKNKTKQRA